MARPIGVTVLATVLIGIGVISMLSLPNVIRIPVFESLTVETYKEKYLSYFEKKSKKEEFIKFMDSPQGKEMIKRTNGLPNSMAYQAHIVLPIFETILWIFAAILGFGLFKLKGWSRRATIIFMAIAMTVAICANWAAISSLFNMLDIYDSYRLIFPVPEIVNYQAVKSAMLFYTIGVILIKVTLGLATIFYLTRPKIKKQFK